MKDAPKPAMPAAECWRLVGQFMHHWALVEKGLDKAMGIALGLDTLQAEILAPNIAIGKKVAITMAAVSLAVMTTKRIKHYRGVLSEIRNFAAQKRNIVAHYPFGPSDDGSSVEFLVVHAKDKLSFPDEVWDSKAWSDAFSRMKYFDEQMVNLCTHLKEAEAIKPILERLHASPKQGTPSPEILGLLGLPSPDIGRSDTPNSTPETDRETPPSSEE